MKMNILVILAIQLIAISFDNCDAHWIPDNESLSYSRDDSETTGDSVKRVRIEQEEEFEEILLPEALEELSIRKLSIEQETLNENLESSCVNTESSLSNETVDSPDAEPDETDEDSIGESESKEACYGQEESLSRVSSSDDPRDVDGNLKKFKSSETELDAMKPSFARDTFSFNNPVKTIVENVDKPDEAVEGGDDDSNDYEDSSLVGQPTLTKEQPVRDIDNNIDADIKESEESSSEPDFPEAEFYAPKKASEKTAPLDLPSGGLLTRLKNIFTYVKSQFEL